MQATGLTVKHVEQSGFQSITTALSVSYEPEDKGERATLFAFGVPAPVSDGCNRYSTGTVYVMNGDGSTVAKYDLD